MKKKTPQVDQKAAKKSSAKQARKPNLARPANDARPAVAASGAMQRVRARSDRPTMRPDLPMRSR
jgi:hypothetical protein